MTKSYYFVLIAILLGSAAAQQCSVADSDKIDCGYVGITQDQCQAKGCCWASSTTAGTPWCFNQAGNNPCANITFTADGPGFTESDFSTMYGYFLQNINIGGQGGVVAAPDHNTPGGSYYYHWSRDGALTMRAFQELNDFDLSKIEANMNSYVNWVNKVHALTDPHDIDIRTEVKYELPQGDVYAGGWCRPQNDGPALRAITLIKYAQTLIKNGKMDYVKQYLWTGSSAYQGGAIKYDLDYVPTGHTTQTCDLWEEIRSTDLFWNKITARYAMILGAEFAAQMGDNNSAQTYAQTAKDIESTIVKNHWNNNFIQEEANRQKDAAVIVGFNDGFADDTFFAPNDAMIASTIKAYNTQACIQYPINQIDNKNGIPGVLYGRYAGDNYAGGNPWVLSTGALASVFYRNAEYIDKMGSAYQMTSQQLSAWKQVLTNLSSQPSNSELRAAFISAGDAVMQRLHYHVKSNGFHLNEQIDKNSGVQMSANDLTWSYAEVLKAFYLRSKLTQSSDLKQLETTFLQK